MRVILYLKSLGQYEINFEYHKNIQGFVYSLLRNTKFENLHDKKGYKFFCFSNIFTREKNDSRIYHLIISSPYDNFIEQISYQLEKIIDNQIPLEIGSLFELQSFIKIKNQKSPFPLQMITGSPIIVRIPIEKFKEFSTESTEYKTIYWRSSHPIQLFVNAVESNLKKKYQEFSNTKITGQLFEKFTFKKQISTKIEIENDLVPIIGSMWELGFTSSIQKEVQLFALDCGLGERNSLGFGFMNAIFPTKN